LRDPRPQTFGEHWAHIAAHPARPQDRPGAAAFIAGHVILTMPPKAAGKALRGTGWLLMHAGTRLDWASDRALRLLAVLIIGALITGVVVFFA
jgi:hypothetical protein